MGMIATSRPCGIFFSGALKPEMDLDLPKLRWVRPDVVYDLIKRTLAEHLGKTAVVDNLVAAWSRHKDIKERLSKSTQGPSSGLLNLGACGPLLPSPS
jgi:hypothetical protein